MQPGIELFLIGIAVGAAFVTLIVLIGKMLSILRERNQLFPRDE